MILWRALRRRRARVLAGCVLLGVHQASEASVPILIGLVIDRAVATGKVTSLVVWIGLLGLLFLALATAFRYGSRQLMRAIADEAHALRMEVAAKALRADGLRTGDALTVTTADADAASYLLDYVPRISSALIGTAVGAVGLWSSRSRSA